MYRSAESLYCMAETNTPLYINCTRIKIKKKKEKKIEANLKEFPLEFRHQKNKNGNEL